MDELATERVRSKRPACLAFLRGGLHDLSAAVSEGGTRWVTSRDYLLGAVHLAYASDLLSGRERDTLARACLADRAQAPLAIRKALESGGFLELADVGPNSKSKIGNRVERIELRKVTSVTEVSARAVDAWEKA